MKAYAAAVLLTAMWTLTSCALVERHVAVPEVAAEVAVKRFEMGQVKLIDVRASHERVGREVARAIHLQFGPDSWGDKVDEVQTQNFLLALAYVARRTDEILIICNYNIRSTAAARLLRTHGYVNVSSIAGGYMGTRGHPGWEYFE